MEQHVVYFFVYLLKTYMGTPTGHIKPTILPHNIPHPAAAVVSRNVSFLLEKIWAVYRDDPAIPVR
jgi:hypothetical protein